MSRVMHPFWGAQAASLQVSAACRDREIESRQKLCAKDVAGRGAGNYRLAACAPQKHARRRTLGGKLCATQAGSQNPRRLVLAVLIRAPANTARSPQLKPHPIAGK